MADNRMHELSGYNEYYRDSHASQALAIADALSCNLNGNSLKKKSGTTTEESSLALSKNSSRSWLQVQNLSDSNFLYINFRDKATVSECVKIKPNDIWESKQPLLITEDIYVFGGENNVSYCVMFGEKA